MNAHENTVETYLLIVDIYRKIIFVNGNLIACIGFVMPAFRRDIDYEHIKFIAVDIIINGNHTLITYFCFPAITACYQRDLFLHALKLSGKEIQIMK